MSEPSDRSVPRLAQCCRTCPLLSLDRRPERLVVEGYRYWMNGYLTGEVACWEMGWTLYSNELGSQDAKRAVSELAVLVRSIRSALARDPAVYPYGARRLCRDECLVAAMIAGYHNGEIPLALKAARYLAGNREFDAVSEAARPFGAVLEDLGLKLAPVPHSLVDAMGAASPSAMVH